jgi:hypothetical protein
MVRCTTIPSTSTISCPRPGNGSSRSCKATSTTTRYRETSRVWGVSAFLAPTANGTPPERKHPGIGQLLSLPGSPNTLLSSRQRARVRALAACEDFLTLWKDTDPDNPILKEAKAEYAKLQ